MSRVKKIVPGYILDLPPYPKGRQWRGEEKLIRLSSNENALGPPSKVVEAIAGTLKHLHRYPDGTGRDLKLQLARKLGFSVENFVVGNGSDEIFELVVRTFLQQGEEVLLPEPTFAFYRIAAQAHGGTCVSVPLREYKIDLVEISRRVTTKTKLIFLANPNNPTGTFFARSAFADFIARLPSDVVVVVDEAYGDYATDSAFPAYRDYQHWDRWIVTTKTFSKFYGLAGLRIGYGIGAKELIEQMEKVRQPFNVSLPALVGAQIALEDERHSRMTARMNAEGKEYFYRELDRLGVSFVPSEANFVLIELGDQAPRIKDKLAKKGIVVRGMEGYGLARHLRITIGLPEENRKFVEALEQCLRNS